MPMASVQAESQAKQVSRALSPAQSPSKARVLDHQVEGSPVGVSGLLSRLIES